MTDQIEWMRLNRTIKADIQTVWLMWTDAEAFGNWYGPMGMTAKVDVMNVATGGQRKISMSTADGKMTMWFVGEYLEVEPPSRLVYSESMADAAGNILSQEAMGMPAGHPETTKVIVELEARGDETVVKLTHIGVPAGSPGEGGWAHALESLAAMAEN